MDETDEIVEEIPIHLSKTFLDNLYIFQYPSSGLQFSPSDADVVKSAIKPLNEHIKVDFALNTASKHYDAFKGEQFALASDGQKNNRSETLSFKSGTMDRQTFISSKPIENTDRYVLGILQDNELHISPIKGILQMRPNFMYFDKMDKRNKDEQAANTNADGAEDEPKQVTVKFAREENDSIRKAREKSFNFISKKLADEPWCETMWYGKESKQAEMERGKFFSSNNDSTGDALNLSQDDYIKSLILSEKSDQDLSDLVQPKFINKAQLQSMSLSDQIRIILTDVRLVRFDKLMAMLTSVKSTQTTEKVLRTLPSVGILLKGCWTVLSEIIYPEGSVSSINGVPAELMCRARDYVLYLFSKDERIDRKRIAVVAQIPAEEVKEILLGIAQLDSSNTWTLIQLPDTVFESKFQELKQRQDVYWRAKEQKFKEMEEQVLPKRTRKKSVREAGTSSGSSKS